MKNYFPNNRSFGVHLDNIGHLILSDYLFRKLVPIIQNDKKIDCDTQFFVR